MLKLILPIGLAAISIVGVVSLASNVPEAEAYTTSATWYGPSFYGNKTSSGETFSSAGLTAAHPSLPFGTILNIVGPNGRNIPVKVNDRCACSLDLSEGAAEATGVKEVGRAEVTATPVGASEDAPKPSESLPALPSTGGSGGQ